MKKMTTEALANMFEDSLETGEVCFYGKSLHSFYDKYEGVATFYAEDKFHLPKGGTISIQLEYSKWVSICKKIETSPEDYYIQKELGYDGEEYGILFRRLEEMPFDRWDGTRFIHATGAEYLESDGSWITEYEDDTENCCILDVIYFEPEN